MVTFGALGKCVTAVLAAALWGFASGTPALNEVQTRKVAETAVITAVSVSGETSALTGEDAETFEEYSTPIDPSEVTFEENRNLSSAEVEERKGDLSTDYAVGEPLTFEDLEFMRAYLIEEEPAREPTEPAIETASFPGSGTRIVPAALYNLNQSFNVNKSGAGASANAYGRITGGINLADANWAVSWTTKRTGGAALTKITSSVRADAFGAVAAWPFVGLIYSQSYSATSPNAASNWSFSRSGRVTGAVAYMQIDCKSFVYTKSGSFSLP